MARLLTVEQIGPQEKLFTVELPDGYSLEHEPGQFAMISVLGVSEAPLSAWFTTPAERNKNNNQTRRTKNENLQIECSDGRCPLLPGDGLWDCGRIGWWRSVYLDHFR
jgi:hypothetical protein